MQMIALTFLGSLLYSMGMFMYLPCKLYYLKRTSRDVWAYFSRTRLLLTGLAYLVSSPGPGFIAFCISAGSVSGSHAVSVPDWLETFGWAFFIAWLAIAVTLLCLSFRPRQSATNTASDDLKG
jgi:hypothetical protein